MNPFFIPESADSKSGGNGISLEKNGNDLHFQPESCKLPFYRINLFYRKDLFL